MRIDQGSVRFGRRGLLTGSGALGLTGLLAACGADTDTDTGTSSEGEAWSFTDDRPETVALDATPRNLVAYTGMAAALYDFGVLATGVFGPTADGEGNPTTQAGDLPIDQLTVIGNTWGEFDVETYAALAPEALLTHYYVDPAAMWYVPEGIADEVTALAPTVLLNADDGANTLDEVVARHAALAEALGADLEASAVVAGRERYDGAVEALRAAAEANPVRVLACSAAAEVFYASNPGSGNDLRFFAELGVDLIVPEDLDAETGGYYEILSWENADKYEADLLLLDARPQSLQPDGLGDFPTWNALPAVRAGQIVGWDAEPLYSYNLAAASIERLAEAVASAERLS